MKASRNGKTTLLINILNHFKMEINTTLPYYFLKSVKTSFLFLLLFLTVNCSNTEPAFTVKGNPAITKDIIVNVEIMHQDGNRISTAYYNGKSYEINNQDALRYSIYVSYQNRYFYSFKMDNLHYKIKGEPINEITIEEKDGAIMASYKPFKGSDKNTETALKPANLFFTTHKKAEKEKFTTHYNK